MSLAHVWTPGTSDLTVLALHGTGGDEHDLIPLAQSVAPRASVLSVRGQVLEGTALRFFRRLGEGVFDLEDLTFRTNELADFVLAQSQERGFAMNRCFALGYSNGANIAAAMLLLRPEAIAGGALLRSMPPIHPSEPPDLRAKKVLMMSGEHDPILPLNQARELAAMLQGYGCQVSLEVLPTGHGLTRRDVDACTEWFAALG